MGGSSFSSAGRGSGFGSSGFGSSGFGSSRGSGISSDFGSGFGSRAFGAPVAHRHTSVNVGMSPFFFPMGFGGNGLVTLAAAAGIAYFLSGVLSSPSSRTGGDGKLEDEESDQTGVAKVQLGLLSSARYLQDKLNNLGDRIDTDTPQGLSTLLQETVLEINRNPEYVEYAFVDTKDTYSLDRAE